MQIAEQGTRERRKRKEWREGEKVEKRSGKGKEKSGEEERNKAERRGGQTVEEQREEME